MTSGLCEKTQSRPEENRRRQPRLDSAKFVSTSHGQSRDCKTIRAASHSRVSSGCSARGPSATTSRRAGFAARMRSKTRAVRAGRLKIKSATGAILFFAKTCWVVIPLALIFLTVVTNGKIRHKSSKFLRFPDKVPKYQSKLDSVLTDRPRIRKNWRDCQAAGIFPGV